MAIESYQDQLSIETPEHVALRLPVADVGSRFLAIFMDALIQALAYLIFVLLITLVVYYAPAAAHSAEPSPRMMAWTIAILIFLHFLAFWGYFTLFEGFWHGQTPGKRIFKLRVIKDSGRQITVVEAMARNLLRVVDMFPSVYLVGIITVMCNRERKRLGDLVAGTLVVHTEELGDLGGIAESSRTITSGLLADEPLSQQPDPLTAEFSASAIARLGEDDLILLDTFFARIPDLDVATKEAFTRRLVQMLCIKMQVPEPGEENMRAALDSIAYQLRNQSGFSVRF